MKRPNRLVIFAAIAIVAVILLTLIAAPVSNQNRSGSTYSRSPDGYGAWYAFMQQRGVNIQRWQKPLGDLVTEKQPVTLLQVSSNWQKSYVSERELQWLEKGNTLVVLGVREPVTGAKFITQQNSPVGNVEIATSRRRNLVSPSPISITDTKNQAKSPVDSSEEKLLLGDRDGAVVWELKVGKGKAIFAVTPHLAANAYQDNPGNFPYLATLVSEKNHKLFVDEYIHGYKDKQVQKTEKEGNLTDYLAKTPLFPALIQVGVMLLILAIAQNRRLGKPVIFDNQVVDNSEAYIQALAGVLQKADSQNFVVEMVGKAEQLQLQKSLGLGKNLLDSQIIIDTWQQKTGENSSEILDVLNLPSRKRNLSEGELKQWLQKWQMIRGKIASK
ncbi:DUF4350 domain-containing protein [Calothrix sp. 336/3]|uniref:DUF4350 domain-containing protein n=1 Tax=Calothrix sp. 336/3 TaxID=1337936 RepID=UPI0004E2E815|nr:DUF4350 domain-containing protein [Calothrix sp. 336/3]AKG24007.1 hypothetical protein IJ00_24260 [Calothrix sp. 336/3]